MVKILKLVPFLAVMMILTGCSKNYIVGDTIPLSEIYSVSIAGSDGMTFSSQWSYFAYRNSHGKETYIEWMHWDEEKRDVVTDRFDIPDEKYEEILAVIDGCKYVKDPKPDKHVMDAPSFSGVRIGWMGGGSNDYHIESPDENVNITAEVIKAIRTAAGIDSEQ